MIGKCSSLTDRLGDLADEMKRGGFSHVPIVDERDAVIGVFNDAAVSITCGQRQKRSSVGRCRSRTFSLIVVSMPIT